MSVVIKGSEPFDFMIVSNIVNCQTANIKLKNISFRCETIEDADGTVFVKKPSAQPERKKGKWIPMYEGQFTGGAYWFECSDCGLVVPNARNGGWNFCPNCGADMREGEEDGN